MPITVTGPDNITVSFPDGTASNVINDVMTKHFGGAAKASPITTGGLMRAAAEGVPVAGGFVNKGIAAAKAALPGTLGGSQASTFGERYSADLPEEEAASAKFNAEHPYASTAAGLAGGVAAALPLGATALGARLLGLGGRTLTGQIARGAASGAGINAADALVRGNDIGTAAVVGGGLGAAAAPVARVIGGAVVAPTARMVRGIVNPQAEAALTTARTIQAGQDLAQATPGHVRNPLTPAEYAAAQASGQPVMALDLAGQPGRDLARAAANVSPEGHHIFNAAIDDRFTGQANQFANWFQGTLHYRTPAARDQMISNVQRTVYEPRYDAAYQAARNVELWPGSPRAGTFSPAQQQAANGLQELAQAPEVQQAIGTAIPQLRNRAVIEGVPPPNGAFRIDTTRTPPLTTLRTTQAGNPYYPTLEGWDQIKRALDRMGTQESSNLARQIRGHLDTLVPEYAAARDAAYPIKFFDGAPNAYEAGRNFIGMKLGTEGRADARAVVGRMAPQERNLFSDGAASELVDQLLRNPDRRNILNRIRQSPAAREELQIAMGPQRFNELEALVRVHDVMDLGRQAVQGNSTSVRQLVQLGLAGGTGIVESGNPLNWDSSTIMHAAMVYGAARGKSVMDERVARQIAAALTSPNPQQVNFGMRLLARSERMMNTLRAGHNALARSAATQAQPQAVQ